MFVVCCLLCVVCCGLIVVRCFVVVLLFSVWWVVPFGYCVSFVGGVCFVARWFLFVGCCLSVGLCYMWFVAWRV